MDYSEWRPIYEAICRDFGYEQAADAAARDRLNELTAPFADEQLAHLAGADVAVAAAGPTLDEELPRVTDADAIIATTGGAESLAAADHQPELLVTDLDTNPTFVVEATQEGVPAAVHAHGDNVDQLEQFVPRCATEMVLPTTQARPRGHVRNVGGFTDGDRAAYLAHAFGADRLRIAGWDPDDPSLTTEKCRKLEWATWLLTRLETDRDEEFAVLDGRREDLEPPVPIE